MREKEGAEKERRETNREIRMTNDERFDRLDASIGRLMNYLLDFRGEVSGRLQAVEMQMRVLASSQQSFEAKLPAVTRASLENAEAIS